MWRSRTVANPWATGADGSSSIACETILLHHDEMKVAENLARFAIKYGMWKFVRGMLSGAQIWVEERRERVDAVDDDPNAFCRRAPLDGAIAGLLEDADVDVAVIADKDNADQMVTDEDHLVADVGKRQTSMRKLGKHAQAAANSSSSGLTSWLSPLLSWWQGESATTARTSSSSRGASFTAAQRHALVAGRGAGTADAPLGSEDGDVHISLQQQTADTLKQRSVRTTTAVGAGRQQQAARLPRTTRYPASVSSSSEDGAPVRRDGTLQRVRKNALNVAVASAAAGVLVVLLKGNRGKSCGGTRCSCGADRDVRGKQRRRQHRRLTDDVYDSSSAGDMTEVVEAGGLQE